MRYILYPLIVYSFFGFIYGLLAHISSFFNIKPAHDIFDTVILPGIIIVLPITLFLFIYSCVDNAGNFNFKFIKRSPKWMKLLAVILVAYAVLYTFEGFFHLFLIFRPDIKESRVGTKVPTILKPITLVGNRHSSCPPYKLFNIRGMQN